MTKVTPPNYFPWLTPYLMVQDVDIAVDFYKKAFGFEVKEVAPDENGVAIHAEVFYKGQVIMMLGREGACETGFSGAAKSPKSTGIISPISLYVYTENVNEFYKHALEHSAKSLGQPEIMFWGDKMCRLQDPDDYIWCFATRVAEHQ
jgi:PhnB protein